jgi:hypothetical protein
VLEAAGPERAGAAVSDEGDAAAGGVDFADARDGHAVQLARQFRDVMRADGEEQLEVLAAVEREREGVGGGERRRL